jgi:uncharacterized protein HemY
MKRRHRHIVRRMASRLTSQQKKELRLAIAECEGPNNLVSHEEAMLQIEQWLKRPNKVENNSKMPCLTPEQEAELEKAIAETYDPTKLIDHEDVMKKYSKWLK